MAESYSAREARVKEALEAIPSGIKPNIKQLSIQLHLSYDQLLNQYNGVPPKQSHCYALTEEEENAIHHYLHRLDRLSMSCQRSMLLRAANSILRERLGSARYVSNHWPTRFLQRNPQYKLRKQKLLTVQRKNAHKPEDILAWFQHFQDACMTCGVDPADIYNFDETEFRIEVGKSQWVITEEWNRPLYQTDADNRDHVTSVECVSATDVTLPPMLILAEKQHLANWFQESLNPDTI